MLARSIRSIIVSAIVLSLVSCGGGDNPSQPKDNGGGTQTLSISLTTTAARPGESVPIQGIAPEVDLEGAVMIAAEAGAAAKSSTYAGVAGALAEGEWVVFVSRDEGGTPFFVSPLVPSTPADGGDIELRLEGINFTSNTVTFTVDPLPAATETVGDMVDRLQGLLDVWLDVHGVTRDELRAMEPTAMPKYLFPLWIAHDILDSPDNPNSLRAAVDGPIPIFNDETIDFDVADRMVSASGVIGFLTEDAASLDSLPRLDTLTVAMPLPTAKERTNSKTALNCNIPAGNYGISTASQLDIAMEQGVNGFNRLDGDAGETLSALGKLATAAGVVPQLKPGATVISAGLYVYQLFNEAAGKLLPTAFDYQATDFDIAGNDLEYNEDDEGGFWTELHVTATSQGWALDQDIGRALLKIAKLSTFGGIPLPDEWGEFAANLAKYAISEGTKWFMDQATLGEDFLEVCPGVWNITEGMASSVFSKSEIVSGMSFKMSSHTFFETDGPGFSDLQVGSRPGRFGNVPPATKKKSIEVIAIEVEVTPSPVTMDDSEVQTFDAVVKNASDDKVTWTVPPPLQEVELTNFGKTIAVQAPAPGTNWDSVVLRARSQANTGSREGRVDSDPRDGFAAINHRDSVVVELDPSYACVQNGEDKLFTAIVYGTDEGVTLNWTLQGYGQISQSGVYTAPPVGITTDQITVTVEEYPYATATATARVGACNCEYQILTAGLNISGGDVAYLYSELGDFRTYTFFYELQDYGAPDGVAFSISITPTDETPAPLIGETGIWDIGVSYIDAGGQGWTTNPPEGVTVELFIEEHTDTYMKGQFSGTLARGGDPDVTIIVSGSFRAGRWGDRWPCE